MVRRMQGGRQTRRGGVRTRRTTRNTGAHRMNYVPASKGKMGLVMDQLVTTRMFRIANISVTALNFSAGYDFRLSYLPNNAEFTALFDAYKIWKVEVQFIPKYNSSDFSSGGVGFGLPTIYITEDRNDVTTPLSVAELQEYNSCIARRFDKTVSYTCWPTIATSGIGNPNEIIDSRQKDLFVRSTKNEVPHYGLKWALDLPVGLETFRMDVVFKYFLMMKDVK